MGVTWSQIFPPPAHFTEKDLSSLKGKVYVVTGGTSGVGKRVMIPIYMT